MNLQKLEILHVSYNNADNPCLKIKYKNTEHILYLMDSGTTQWQEWESITPNWYDDLTKDEWLEFNDYLYEQFNERIKQ